MTYAVLRSLAQTIAKIQSHDHKQYPISVDGKQQIASIDTQLKSLQKFLHDFPHEASSLEARIWTAANHAEDVIEHFMYEEDMLRYKSTRSGGAAEAADIQHDFHELERVVEEMNSVSREAANIRGNRLPAPLPAPSSSPAPEPTGERFTVGLEKDLEKIRGLVCGESLERQIIPITGMGGIGKTTLAEKVYHDASVRATFPVHAWVTVSQNHNAEKIYEDLLSCLVKVVGEDVVNSSESTKDKVYHILKVRKYLVVLDDLWSEKAWDDIRAVFGGPGDRYGSRILITTRNEGTASHVSPSSALHQMRLLEKEDSWDLLKNTVFPKRECPYQLVEIGKDVATNCGGLPLAIVLVAGILSTSGEARESWEEIARDVHAAVDKNDKGFSKIISLSYTHLPIRYRPCFLYMGGFPEDYEIRVSKLIKLWTAEGFVQNEGEAIEYLQQLLWRNLPSIKNFKSNGKAVKSCSIHDLVRDMCKRKALDENYERRLSIAHPDLTHLARAYASTLRSLISFQPNEVSLASVRKFKLLRMLDVVDTDAYSLPATVFELFHLRYLAFGCPMEIPTTISKLRNLRALIIRPSKRLRKLSTDEVDLPLEIWMLPLLEHLVSFFDILPNPEGAASALENLQTLSVVKKFICTEEMMKLIPNLKKLAVTYFGDKIKFHDDYQLQNLRLLQQLEKLTLVLKEGSDIDRKGKPVFPKTLRKLTLSGWRFPWDDMDEVSSLPNLEVLKLRDYACQGDTWEPMQFSRLKFLLIEGSDLENWETGKADFPALKHLVLHGCGNLEKIPEDMGAIGTLETIDVGHANKPLRQCVQRIVIDQAKYNKILLV